MYTNLEKTGGIIRLSMLSSKVVDILLLRCEKRYTNFYKNDKEILSRAKELILDKIVQGAKICQGKEIDDYSDGSDGVSLYGYALPVCLQIFKENLCYFKKSGKEDSYYSPDFFEELSTMIVNIINGNKIPSDSPESLEITKEFFKLFAEKLRSRIISVEYSTFPHL